MVSVRERASESKSKIGEHLRLAFILELRLDFSNAIIRFSVVRKSKHTAHSTHEWKKRKKYGALFSFKTLELIYMLNIHVDACIECLPVILIIRHFLYVRHRRHRMKVNRKVTQLHYTWTSYKLMNRVVKKSEKNTARAINETETELKRSKNNNRVHTQTAVQ